jgi:hypothetical protein
MKSLPQQQLLQQSGFQLRWFACFDLQVKLLPQQQLFFSALSFPVAVARLR